MSAETRPVHTAEGLAVLEEQIASASPDERPALLKKAVRTASHCCPDRVDGLAAQALPLLEGEANATRRSWFEGQLGWSAQARGDFEAAMFWLDRALASVDEGADPAARGNILNMMGVVHWRLDDYPVALERLHEALSLENRYGNVTARSRCMTNIGIVLAAVGDFEGALGQYERAIALKSEVNDVRGEANILNNIAGILTQLERLDEATERLHEAAELYARLGDRAGEVATMINLAELAERQGDRRQAADRYSRAISLARSNEDRDALAQALLGASRLALTGGDIEGAQELLIEARELAEEIGAPWLKQEVLLELAAAHAEAGDFAQALQEQRLAQAEAETVHRSALEASRSTIAARFRLHEARAAEESSEMRARLAEAEVGRQESRVIALSGGLVGLLAIGLTVLGWSLYRRRALVALGEAHSEIRRLKGLIPICSSCKKVREEAGQWTDVEAYVTCRSEAQFTHGICPDCLQIHNDGTKHLSN